MNAAAGTLVAALTLLYGGTALADNTSPSMLTDDERVLIEELLPLDMDAFALHDEPRPFRGSAFRDPRGRDTDLSEFEGGVTVVNFWATWCPPCRKELPYFDELQAELGDEGIRVVTISLDRQGVPKARKFLKDQGLDNLPAYADPKANLGKEMGIRGLPVTAILGPDAREIGRLTGEAEWHSEDAKDWLRAIVAAMAEEDEGA